VNEILLLSVFLQFLGNGMDFSDNFFASGSEKFSEIFTKEFIVHTWTHRSWAKKRSQ